MTKEDIILHQSIVHILDSTLEMPVLSDKLLETGIDLSEFICTHIAKLLSGDDLKQCYFQTESSAVYTMLKSYQETDFISFSKSLATRLYTIMNENPAIPSADFFVISFQCNGDYLALLKMNYRDTYVHFTGQADSMETSSDYSGNYNRIMKQTATLPSSGSHLSEAVIISLSDFTIRLVEKKYEINGKKEYYLSSRFLECGTNLSQKAKMKIVSRAVDQINEKYFDQDFNKKMTAKSIIQKEIEEDGSLQIEKTAAALYAEIPEIKEEFMKKMEKYEIEKEEIRPQNPSTTKKLSKQYLTTDTGIEINIPMELYDDIKNVEFMTGSDGTISILIKNINHIQAK